MGERKEKVISSFEEREMFVLCLEFLAQA